MRLSKEQIQQVEAYLTQKGLKYIDVRYEVLDHMVTNIEHLMNSKNISFEEASNQVYLKWNRSFYSKSSLWIGLAYSGPKLFIDNCVTIYKRIILKTQLYTFAIIYGLGYFFKYFQISELNYNQEIIITLNILVSIGIIVPLYWFYQIKKTKLQTSYSFLFTRNVLPTVLIFGILSLLLSEVSSLTYSFTIFGLWSGSYLYKHHMKSVSKLSFIP